MKVYQATLQILCYDAKKSQKKDKSPGQDGIPSLLLKELAEEISYRLSKIVSGFTGFWTITKRLADSQHIANLQRGPACRSEKLPTRGLHQHVLKSNGTYN